MSYVWFNEVLAALGKRLQFESLSSLYGNSFFKDANKIITQANPLYVKQSHGPNISQIRGDTAIIDLSKATQKQGGQEIVKRTINKQVGNVSWALNFLKNRKESGDANDS